MAWARWISDQARRRSRRNNKRPSRPLQMQTLEARRMMVAEGALYTFNGSFNVAGLVGNANAAVDWGDGTTSPVSSITGGNATGNLRIRFDYSLDTRGFFSGANAYRRNVLQIAGDSLIKRFGDDLAAIIPGGIKEWIPSVNHPSNGPSNSISGKRVNLAKNLRVNANEIIVYAGARNLPGNFRGVGGQASYQFPATSISCRTQAECNRKLAEIEAFRNIVRGRGEPGALGNTQTDVAPQIGTISFDTNSDWYFGLDPDGIGPNQVDFLSVATHELGHVLGFGNERSGVTTSWERLTSNGRFNGPKARAAYVGSGSPPISGDHWANSIQTVDGQSILMNGSIPIGKRTHLSPLDMAAFDDLGWDLLNMRATVSASHRYPDDGSYDVRVILKGSRAGEVPWDARSVNVTNVRPTLKVVENQTVTVGEAISLTDLGMITDPGFRNTSTAPTTDETFTYSIQWGDGTEPDQGQARIDVVGNASPRLTQASFDGIHTYTTVGNKTVTVRVTDDDGAVASGTFRIQVLPPPAITLRLDESTISESSGTNAATLTIERSGPARTTNQRIQLSSDDTTEARLPSSVVIPANATSAEVPVQAVDDALLDGTIAVNLTASATGLESDTIEILVADHESLTASLSSDEATEGDVVTLTLQRSNNDTDAALNVQVSGIDPAELDLPSSLTIPAGRRVLSYPIQTRDDSEYEKAIDFLFAFASDGYTAASTNLRLLDNEPPRFQNQVNPFDVNEDGRVTAADALRIINQLARLAGEQELDPADPPVPGFFVDVNGDYVLSARDALQVINQLSRQSTDQEGEQVGKEESVGLAFDTETGSWKRDEDRLPLHR